MCSALAMGMQTVTVRTNKSPGFTCRSWAVAERNNIHILFSFNYLKFFLCRKKGKQPEDAHEIPQRAIMGTKKIFIISPWS